MLFVSELKDIIEKMKCLWAQRSSCLFVTDENTYPIYEKLIHKTATNGSCHGDSQYPILVLQAGEAHKGITQVSRIWDFLHEQQATRQSLLVAIGGGTISDLAGFAAATYKRGMHYVNMPTTLLSMVDASIGGKTGFNLHNIKNEIGCFYPPEETVICPEVLLTLPRKEWLSGFAEMLKHALIADTDEWWELLRMAEEDLPQTAPVIGERIKHSIAIKETIIRQDPQETGLRKVLNFGHTIGHAIEAEAISRHIDLPHGIAVMEGMVAELYLSVTQLGMDKEALRQMTHLMIEQYGKTPFSCKDFGKLIAHMRQDKKNESATQINFTLLSKIGQPKINCVVGEKEIEEALEYLFTI